MRLLNVKTRKLELFFGDNVPPYAILSHRWGDKELSFQDIQSHRYRLPRSWPTKLEGCRQQAKADGLQYMWVDTCCIDKSSSSELEEAINSMFAWYRSAAVCYAYLPDVPPGDVPHAPDSHFRASAWFTRGWTLQELLAPSRLVFYNARWACMGTKSEMSLVIENITGISRAVLLGIKDVHQASVAQRLSWAANRVTTRREDAAYCLLGILGVTMPMIYGEGDRAFLRLQDEILRSSPDQSILAGAHVLPVQKIEFSFEIQLATSPTDFAGAGCVIPCKGYEKEPNWILDMLLQSKRDLHSDKHLRCPTSEVNGESVIVLNCCDESKPYMAIGLPVQVLPSDNGVASEMVAPKSFCLVQRACVDYETDYPATVTVRSALSDAQNSTPSTQDWWYFHNSIESAGWFLVEADPPLLDAMDIKDMLASRTAQEVTSQTSILLRFRFFGPENQGAGEPESVHADFLAALIFPALSGKSGILCLGVEAAQDEDLVALRQTMEQEYVENVLGALETPGTDGNAQGAVVPMTASGEQEDGHPSTESCIELGKFALGVVVVQDESKGGTIFAVHFVAVTEEDVDTEEAKEAVEDGVPDTSELQRVITPTISSSAISDAVESKIAASQPNFEWPVWFRFIVPLFIALFSTMPVHLVYACFLAPLAIGLYWKDAPIVKLQLAMWFLYALSSGASTEPDAMSLGDYIETGMSAIFSLILYGAVGLGLLMVLGSKYQS
ncbi:hypothetical protein OQA88_10871 [Cercophora sp. LCS_1]